MSEELPILDLSAFHVHQPPGKVYRIMTLESYAKNAAPEELLVVYRILKPRSAKERAALQELVGVLALADESFRDVSKHGNTPQVLWRLHNVAKTPQHEIVAVGLQLIVAEEEIEVEGELEWTVYLVAPDHYQGFWSALQDQLMLSTKENFVRWLYKNHPKPESRYVEITTNVDVGNGAIEKTTWADEYEISMRELAFELAVHYRDDHYLPESIKELPEGVCTFFIRPAKRRRKKQMWLKIPPKEQSPQSEL